MLIFHLQVCYYDPYVNVAELKVPNAYEWGLFRCFPISLIDLMDDWILRKESALNNYPLSVTIFERYPTMVQKQGIPPVFLKTHYAEAIEHSKGYGGFDGFILANLAKVLQFEVVLIKSAESYGLKTQNDTFTGTLGDVLYHRADISFNARFLIEYGTPDIEFLFPVIGDKVCVIAPSADRIPQWSAIFKCFDVYVWSSFVLVTCLCGAFWFILKRSARYKRWNHRHLDIVVEILNFKEIFVSIWMIMLGANATMPVKSMERLFIGACLITNVIIAGTFQVKSTKIC